MSMTYATITVNDETGEVKNFQRHYELKSAESIASKYVEKGWTNFVFTLNSMYGFPAAPKEGVE